MTTIDDPKRVIYQLLLEEWDAANTGGMTPLINTGWRDTTLTKPIVTVGNDEESPVNATGFSGIEPTGAGPTATTRGTVAINLWVTRPLAEKFATITNPKALATALADEVKRIVREHINISSHDFGPAGLSAEHYRYLSYLGRDFLPEEPDASEAPIEYRYRVELRYEYLDRP